MARTPDTAVQVARAGAALPLIPRHDLLPSPPATAPDYRRPLSSCPRQGLPGSGARRRAFGRQREPANRRAARSSATNPSSCHPRRRSRAWPRCSRPAASPSSCWLLGRASWQAEDVSGRSSSCGSNAADVGPRLEGAGPRGSILASGRRVNPGARVCPGAVLDLVEQREAFSDYPCLEAPGQRGARRPALVGGGIRGRARSGSRGRFAGRSTASPPCPSDSW